MLDEYRGIYAEGKKKIKLTERETLVFLMFLINKNRYITAKHIAEKVETSEESIISAIYRLRDKLKRTSVKIYVRSGIGYKVRS